MKREVRFKTYEDAVRGLHCWYDGIDYMRASLGSIRAYDKQPLTIAFPCQGCGAESRQTLEEFSEGSEFGPYCLACLCPETYGKDLTDAPLA